MFEIRYRIERTPEGKFRVDCALEPFDGLATPWGHFGDYDTLNEATEEAGNEIGYQYRRSLLTPTD